VARLQGLQTAASVVVAAYIQAADGSIAAACRDLGVVALFVALFLRFGAPGGHGLGTLGRDGKACGREDSRQEEDVSWQHVDAGRPEVRVGCIALSGKSSKARLAIYLTLLLTASFVNVLGGHCRLMLYTQSVWARPITCRTDSYVYEAS
jgi:hypothetical protein